MYGILKIPPWEFTLKEYYWMMVGHLHDEWGRTQVLVNMIAGLAGKTVNILEKLPQLIDSNTNSKAESKDILEALKNVFGYRSQD